MVQNLKFKYTTPSQTSGHCLDVWKDLDMAIPMFKIVSVARGPKTYAKLRSLAPVLTLNFDDGFSWQSKEVISQLYDLTRTRRASLFRLAKDGWTRAQYEWDQLFGCPPVACWSLPYARPCKLAYLCPFCWVRYVVAKLYDHIAWALYGTTQLQYGQLPIRHVDLVLLKRQTIIRLDDYADTRQIYHDVRNLSKAVCQSNLRGKTLGFYSFASLEPIRDFDANAVFLNESILAVTVPYLKLGKVCEKYGFSSKRLSCAYTNPWTLAEFIGSGYEYPAGLMFGSTKVTHSILNVRSRRRKEERPPPLSQYWGYLQQFPIFKFDVQCHLAYQENCTDAIKPNTSAALRGIST